MSGLPESRLQLTSPMAALLSVLFLITLLLPASRVDAAPRDLDPLQALGQSQREAQSGQDMPEGISQPDAMRLLASLLPDKFNPVPPLVLQDSQPLTPCLEHLFDPDFSIDASEAASDQYRHKFEIFAPERMPFFGAPGVTWLRFVLPAQDNDRLPGDRLLLDLGSSVPGEPVLYHPAFVDGALEWQETGAKNGVIELPPLRGTPQLCFLRVDGIPGFWFSPTVLKAGAATELAGWPWHETALVALCVVIVFCLLKGLVEPGQWRLWTLLYLAACATQAWSGIPSTMAGYSPRVLAALTTAGLALMLWPHVARHFLRCREVSRALDTQFILLCLPGAALTLLPLVPNFQWTARFAQVWPLGMAIFVPGALWACVVGAQNAVRFLVATTLPVLATLFAILGMRSGFAPDLLQALPHLGIALGAITLLALGQKDVEAQSLVPAMPLGRKADAFSLDMSEPENIMPAPPAPQEDAEAVQRPLGVDAARDHLLGLRRKMEELLAGAGLPDESRPAMDGLLAKADELAAEIVRLREKARYREEMKTRMTVIAVTGDTAFFAVLAHVLRRRDCHVREAGNLAEAVELSRDFPAKVYVFEGEFAHASSKSFLRQLGELCEEAGILTHFLAYTRDQSNWKDLGDAGFTHALVLPIDDAALFNTLDEFREEESRALEGADQGTVAAEHAETRTVAIEDLPTLEMLAEARQSGAQPGDAGQARPDDPHKTFVVGLHPDTTPDRSGKEPDTLLDFGGTASGNEMVMDARSASRSMDDPWAGTGAGDDEPEEIPDLFGFGSRPSSHGSGGSGGSAGSGGAERASGDGFDARTGQELAHYVSLARSSFLRKDMKEIGRLMAQVCEKGAHSQSVTRLAELVMMAAKAGDATSVRDLLMQLSTSIESRTGTR